MEVQSLLTTSGPPPFQINGSFIAIAPKKLDPVFMLPDPNNLTDPNDLTLDALAGRRQPLFQLLADQLRRQRRISGCGERSWPAV